MGCDIHVYVERKTDIWTALKAPRGTTFTEYERYEYEWEINRWYRMFGVLAGVRWDDGPNLFGDRGIPPDASALVRGQRAEWGSNGHSHSWATATELLAVDWTPHLDPWETSDWAQFLAWLGANDPDTLRVVFWFDN